MIQQFGRDGEQIASGQFRDLVEVAETGPHHLGAVAEGLEVVEDAGHGDHTRIFRTRIGITTGFRLEPIENATDERGDQGDSCLRAGHGLTEAEQQSEVAVNAVFLKHLGSLDALPSGGDLDQNALVADAGVVVETDQLAAFFNRGIRVIAEAGIHLGGHAAGNDLENLFSEDDADLIESLMHHVLNRGVVTDQPAGGAQSLIDQILISGDLCGSENQGWVGGGVAGSELTDRLQVSGICHHDRHRGELLKQAGHCGERRLCS